MPKLPCWCTNGSELRDSAVAKKDCGTTATACKQLWRSDGQRANRCPDEACITTTTPTVPGTPDEVQPRGGKKRCRHAAGSGSSGSRTWFWSKKSCANRQFLNKHLDVQIPGER